MGRPTVPSWHTRHAWVLEEDRRNPGARSSHEDRSAGMVPRPRTPTIAVTPTTPAASAPLLLIALPPTDPNVTTGRGHRTRRAKGDPPGARTPGRVAGKGAGAARGQGPFCAECAARRTSCAASPAVARRRCRRRPGARGASSGTHTFTASRRRRAPCSPRDGLAGGTRAAPDAVKVGGRRSRRRPGIPGSSKGRASRRAFRVCARRTPFLDT
jgi:hypothetical protein